MGHVDRGKTVEPLEVHRTFADTLSEAWRQPLSYDFGRSRLREELFALDRQHWQTAFDFEVPQKMIFVTRTTAGTFGNLKKLGAQVPTNELLGRYLRQAG